MFSYKRLFVFISSTLLVAFFISACTPGTRFANTRYQTVNDVMATWVGSQESKLVASWGAPNGVFDNRDGTRLLTWKQHRETSSHYGTCSQSFLVDKKGIVQKWGFSGFCPDYSRTEPKDTPVPRPTL